MNALSSYTCRWLTEDVEAFRRTVREFVHREFMPVQAQWRANHGPDCGAWKAAGCVGVLLPDLDAEFGGGGGTYAHQAVVLEELTRAGVHFGCVAHGIVGHYIYAYGSEAQKRRWLPCMARGELVAAIAMTSRMTRKMFMARLLTVREAETKRKLAGEEFDGEPAFSKSQV